MKNLLLFTATVLFLNPIFSQSFDIYVSHGTMQGKIMKYDENGENGEIFINEELSGSQDILFLEDQKVVLVSNLGTDKITKYNADDGSYIDDFATDIDGPTKMKIGEDGLLYVIQWGIDGKVLRYELDGTFVDEFTNTGVTKSNGLEWDADGNLYVSAFIEDYVRKFDENGIEQDVFINTSLDGPTNIWFDENGDMLVCNWNDGNVDRFDSNGNFKGEFITNLDYPEGVAYLPNGNILIGNGGLTNVVKMFDPEGNFIKNIIDTQGNGFLNLNVVIVRERALSVLEKEKETNFLMSTVGTGFLLNPIFREILYVEVFNISGELVERKERYSDSICEQGKHADGFYIIRATMSSGEILTQKVVVKN